MNYDRKPFLGQVALRTLFLNAMSKGAAISWKEHRPLAFREPGEKEELRRAKMWRSPSGYYWWKAKNPREYRRVARRKMTSAERRMEALRSMAEKNMIPVQINMNTDWFQVGSYKRVSRMELVEAGFKNLPGENR